MAEIAKNIDKSMFDAMRNMVNETGAVSGATINSKTAITSEDAIAIKDFFEFAENSTHKFDNSEIIDRFNNLTPNQKDMIRKSSFDEMAKIVSKEISSNKKWKEFNELYNTLNIDNISLNDVEKSMVKSVLNCCTILQTSYFKKNMMPYTFMKHITKAVVDDSITQFMDIIIGLLEEVNSNGEECTNKECD